MLTRVKVTNVFSIFRQSADAIIHMLARFPAWVLVFLCYPTILLLTSSSMALTNSAALGVSELDGRTDNREEVWVKIES